MWLAAGRTLTYRRDRHPNLVKRSQRIDSMDLSVEDLMENTDATKIRHFESGRTRELHGFIYFVQYCYIFSGGTANGWRGRIILACTIDLEQTTVLGGWERDRSTGRKRKRGA